MGMWSNSYGQIGDGTTTSRYSPASHAAKEIPLSGIKQISSREAHAIFKERRNSMGVGSNTYGKPGDGTT